MEAERKGTIVQGHNVFSKLMILRHVFFIRKIHEMDHKIHRPSLKEKMYVRAGKKAQTPMMS